MNRHPLRRRLERRATFDDFVVRVAGKRRGRKLFVVSLFGRCISRGTRAECYRQLQRQFPELLAGGQYAELLRRAG